MVLRIVLAVFLLLIPSVLYASVWAYSFGVPLFVSLTGRWFPTKAFRDGDGMARPHSRDPAPSLP